MGPRGRKVGDRGSWSSNEKQSVATELDLHSSRSRATLLYGCVPRGEGGEFNWTSVTSEHYIDLYDIGIL